MKARGRGAPRRTPTRSTLITQIYGTIGLPRPPRGTIDITKRGLIHILSWAQHTDDLVTKLQERCRELEEQSSAD
jgi:hypothetical protein